MQDLQLVYWKNAGNLQEINKKLTLHRYSGRVGENHGIKGGVKMTMITAHSGSDNTEENSWAFLRFCLDRQLCFEVDVRQQTDGTLILAHDR